MGCHSTKAPAAPVAPEAPEADFNASKTLLVPGGEIKKESAVTTEPGDVDSKDVATQDFLRAQPVEAENSANHSTVPATGEGTSADLPCSGVQTVSLTDTDPPATVLQGQDAQQAERTHPEASAQEPEIPTGLQSMTEPSTTEASSLLNKSTEEAAAASKAAYAAALAKIPRRPWSTEDNVIKKVDEKVKGPHASSPDSTSTRKERGMCCC